MFQKVLGLFFATNGTFAWISIAQSAHGVIAIGQFATGFITIGQVTFGVFNLSQVGIGLLFSVSMATAGFGATVAGVAFGGYNIASGFAVSLIRTHFSTGVHVLHPFFSKDKKIYSAAMFQRAIPVVATVDTNGNV